MFKNLLICIVLVTACKNYKLPIIEDCMYLGEGASFCIKGRKEYKVKTDYFFGMSCTNSTDRGKIENAIDTLIVDNKKLKRQLKLKCKKK